MVAIASGVQYARCSLLLCFVWSSIITVQAQTDPACNITGTSFDLQSNSCVCDMQGAEINIAEQRCECPHAFDVATNTCFYPCFQQGLDQEPPTRWRQVFGGGLEDCECGLFHLEGNPVSECSCPSDSAYNVTFQNCVCDDSEQYFDHFLGLCIGFGLDYDYDYYGGCDCAPNERCFFQGEGIFSCIEIITTSSTTAVPTTSSSTTAEPSTSSSTTVEPTTSSSTPEPTTSSSTTAEPTTSSSTTAEPTTSSSSTPAPTSSSSTPEPTTTPTPTTSAPPTTPAPIEPGCSPLLEIARSCNLWVRNDLTVGTGDIEGKVCVGGNLQVGAGLSLGTGLPQNPVCPSGVDWEYSLVVGGDVKWDSGRKFVGAHCLGGAVIDPISVAGPMTLPGCPNDRTQDPARCTDVVDFAADYQQMLALSNELWDGPVGYHRSDARLEGGVILISLDAAFARHVVHVDATFFEGWTAWALRIQAEGGSLDEVEVVVLNLFNVASGGLTIAKYMDYDPAFGSRVLYHYPGSHPIAAGGGSAIQGSLFAPRAPLAGNSAGAIAGQVVVESYSTAISASTGMLWRPLHPAPVCVGGIAPEYEEEEVAFAKDGSQQLATQSSGAAKQGSDSGTVAALTWAVCLLGLLALVLFGLLVTRFRSGRRDAADEHPKSEVAQLFVNMHGKSDAAVKASKFSSEPEASITYVNDPTATTDIAVDSRRKGSAVSGAMAALRKASRISITSPRSLAIFGATPKSAANSEDAFQLASDTTGVWEQAHRPRPSRAEDVV